MHTKVYVAKYPTMTKTFGRGTAQPGTTGKSINSTNMRNSKGRRSSGKAWGRGKGGPNSTPIVSPSQSVKIKKEKLKKTNHFLASSSNDLTSEINLTDDEIPPVEDAVKAFKSITNGILKLEDEALKTYLKSWAIQNPQDLNIKEINGMDHQTIMDMISDTLGPSVMFSVLMRILDLILFILTYMS